MPSAHTLAEGVVWICWGVVVAVWIAGALYNARRAPRARKRSLGFARWTIPVLVAWLVARRRLGIGAVSLHHEPEVIRIAGAVVLVASTGFAVWARLALGTMWSSDPVAKEGHVLHTDGPYAVTRHPIYTGLLGMLLGTALALDFGAWVYVLVLVAVYFELKIRSEEQLMREAFPDAYEEYRRRVPQLIPGLHLLSPSGS